MTVDSIRVIYNIIYICNYIIGSTCALAFTAIWLQLHKHLGPLVINLTRVAIDVATILCNFFLVLVSFSLAVIFVLSVNAYPYKTSMVDQESRNYTDNEEDMTFDKIRQIVSVMFWVFLDPGPDHDTFPGDTFAGLLAGLLFVIYQAFIVIMGLNLLIAMMNTTMQRIQDKELLYWKFARTSIWIEFIEGKQLPPPFVVPFFASILLFQLLYGMSTCMGWMYKKITNRNTINLADLNDEINAQRTKSTKYNCKMDSVESTRRKNHALLMKNLIHCLLQKEIYVAKTISVDNEKHKQITIEQSSTRL